MAAPKKSRAIKAGPATPVAIVPAVDELSPYEEAREKAKDPAMLVKDNPLMRDEDPNYPGGVAEHIQDVNMDRLHQDRRLRRQPNGNAGVYAGFMENRFGG